MTERYNRPLVVRQTCEKLLAILSASEMTLQREKERNYSFLYGFN